MPTAKVRRCPIEGALDGANEVPRLLSSVVGCATRSMTHGKHSTAAATHARSAIRSIANEVERAKIRSPTTNAMATTTTSTVSAGAMDAVIASKTLSATNRPLDVEIQPADPSVAVVEGRSRCATPPSRPRPTINHGMAATATTASRRPSETAEAKSGRMP